MSVKIKKELHQAIPLTISDYYDEFGFGMAHFGGGNLVESHFGSVFNASNEANAYDYVVVAIIPEKRNNGPVVETQKSYEIRCNISVVDIENSGVVNANRSDHIDTSGFNNKSKRNLIFR